VGHDHIQTTLNHLSNGSGRPLRRESACWRPELNAVAEAESSIRNILLDPFGELDDPGRVREDWAPGTADQARPEVRRHDHPALAGVQCGAATLDGDGRSYEEIAAGREAAAA
jgi:hypothetical protein